MLKPHLRGAARRAHGSSAERRRKIGAPAEAQRSGFGGVRRSKGANAVFAVGRNEVERTLRRRGVSFSPIFLQTKKDGATGGRQLLSAAGKYEKQKDYVPEGRSEKRIPVKT